MRERGEWRFQSEENFYYGYLEFSEENEITLEIIEDHIFYHMPGSKCELVILGKLEAQFALIEEHYASIDLKFDSVLVGYSNMGPFISQNSLVYDTSRNTQTPNRYEKQLVIPEICKITLFPEYDSLPQNNRILFSVESYRTKTFSDYVELVYIIQDFLNFVISKEVLIENIYVANNEDTRFNVDVKFKSQRPILQKKNKLVLFKPRLQ